MGKKRNKRVAPILRRPEVQILLSQGLKWIGNYEETEVQEKAKTLVQMYSTVVIAPAFDWYGKPLQGECAIWVDRISAEVDDDLEKICGDVANVIWQQRNLLVRAKQMGIPMELNINAHIAVPPQYQHLLPLLGIKPTP